MRARPDREVAVAYAITTRAVARLGRPRRPGRPPAGPDGPARDRRRADPISACRPRPWLGGESGPDWDDVPAAQRL